MSPWMRERQPSVEHTPPAEPFYLMVPPSATDSLEPIRKWLTQLLAAKVKRAEHDRAALQKLESDIATASQVLTFWEQLDTAQAADIPPAATTQGVHDGARHDDSQPKERHQLRRVTGDDDVRGRHDAPDGGDRVERPHADVPPGLGDSDHCGDGAVLRHVRAAVPVERGPAAVAEAIERRISAGRPRLLSDIAILNALRTHGPQNQSSLAVLVRCSTNTVRRRVSELQRAGLVVRTGRLYAMPGAAAPVAPPPLRAKHVPATRAPRVAKPVATVPPAVVKPVAGAKPEPPLAQRRCRDKRCLRLFTPSNQAQEYCPSGNHGSRVAESTKPKSTSWWLNSTRDGFTQQAQAKAPAMSATTIANSVKSRVIE